MRNEATAPLLSIDKQKYFLAAVVDSSKDSIVTIDFNSVVTSWNQSAEHLYGYPASEAIGKPLSFVVLPDDIRQLLLNIDRIKSSRNVEVYKTIRVRKGGDLVDLEIVLSPVKDEHDEVIGVSTVARDITDRTKAEDALRRSEEKFRSLISQTTVGIYQADLDRVVTFVNDTFCKMFASTADELIGQPIWSGTFHEELECERKLVEDFKQTSTPFEFDKRIVRKNGEVRWMRECVSPIYDSEGKLESTMGVFLDITEEKEIDRHKDEFIGIASHEMKTPLTSLKAYGQILETKLERGDYGESLSLLKRLNKQIERLEKLIVQLLDTGKITGGNLVLQKTRFDLNKLIAEVIDDLQKLTDKHHLELVDASSTLIYAEKERIRQVLTNLMSNAIKYSPDGGNVTIYCKETHNEIHVSVADEGIGIPEEFQSKVFNRFFRVQTDQAGPLEGIGLGLYIASEIIRKHGGRIGVKPNHRRGSIFYFTIPA